MSAEFQKLLNHLGPISGTKSGHNYAQVLFDYWKEYYFDLDPNDAIKWSMDVKLDTNSYILAAEMSNGDIKNVECTKNYVEDALSGAMEFAKPKPPKWKQMDTSFCEKTCEAFLMEAFGTSKHHKPVLSIVSNSGKIMLSQYAGQCPACMVNFAKRTVILYGIPAGHPQAKPTAYHPGCFMKELAFKTIVGTHGTTQYSTPLPDAMRYALRSMGRTADEMRWRRRAKATCTAGQIFGSDDPTLPEYHEWRCTCSVAPWNLTKAQRAETRNKHGVKPK